MLVGLEVGIYEAPVNFLASAEMILISEIKLHLRGASARADLRSGSSRDTRRRGAGAPASRKAERWHGSAADLGPMQF